MTFVFDIDGTISRFVPQFAAIMQGLRASGHRVVVLTGAINGTPAEADRHRQLSNLGITRDSYDQLLIADGWNPSQVATVKAEMLLSMNADMFIDNDPNYCRKARHRSPETAVLMVHP